MSLDLGLSYKPKGTWKYFILWFYSIIDCDRLSVYAKSFSPLLLWLIPRGVSKVYSRDIAIFSWEVSWAVINHWIPQAKYSPLAIFYIRAMDNISCCFVTLCGFSIVTLLKAQSIWSLRSSETHHVP